MHSTGKYSYDHGSCFVAYDPGWPVLITVQAIVGQKDTPSQRGDERRLTVTQLTHLNMLPDQPSSHPFAQMDTLEMNRLLLAKRKELQSRSPLQ